MNDLKNIIAKNIVELRRKENITQLELAEKLNYTDKAVSKWERGESLPDIIILKNIADLFNVSVDYLLSEEHKKEEIPHNCTYKKHNHKLISWMSIFLVFLIATLMFAIAKITEMTNIWYWLPFVYAIPITNILGLVFNSIWFNKKYNYLIISSLVWTILAAIYLTFLAFGNNLWILFILGIPGQGIVLLWSGIRYKSKNNLY